MGLDLDLQAIPDNEDLLNRAKIDEQWCHYLTQFDRLSSPANLKFLKSLFNEESSPLRRTEIEFAETAVKISETHQGIQKRHFDWYRRYDTVWFLLSPYRRSEYKLQTQSEDEQWIYKMIWGGEIINPRAKTGQGGDIRYTPTSELPQIIEILSSITPSMLTPHYPEARKRTYKSMNLPENTDEGTQGIYNILQRLKVFYEQVLINKECVVGYLW